MKSNAVASARQTLGYVRLLERDKARLVKDNKALRDAVKLAKQAAKSGQKD